LNDLKGELGHLAPRRASLGPQPLERCFGRQPLRPDQHTLGLLNPYPPRQRVLQLCHLSPELTALNAP
jgi:hypothetical protein